MSDLTPYEKVLLNQLHNLPLPDVDKAWQDMKEMLDNDDNKGGGEKPSSNNRIGGIALLIILLSIAILWYAHSKKQPVLTNGENAHAGIVKNDPSTQTAIATGNKTPKTSPVSAITENNTGYNKDAFTNNKTTGPNNINTSHPYSSGNNKGTSKLPERTIQSDNTETSSVLSARDKADGSSKNSSVTGNHSISGTKFSRITHKQSRIKNIRSWSGSNSYPNNLITRKNIHRIDNKNKPGYQPPAETSDNSHSPYVSNHPNNLHPVASKGLPTKERRKDSRGVEPTTALANNNNGRPHRKGTLTVYNKKNPSYQNRNTAEIGETTATDRSMADKTDQQVMEEISSIQPGTDALLMKPLVAIKDPSATTKKGKKLDNHKKKAYFTAGIGDQQSIDKSCNCAYPNNIPAKTMAKDYIPSVFLGFHDKKWFLQTEFDYTAPQYVNGTVYRAIQPMPLLFNDTTTTFTIKKIYGHQGSISFNYSILSNLSIGAGLIYTVFSGADIEKTVQKKSYGPVDSLISSTLITDKEDSGFNGLAKNNFQLLLQAQYQWNRFSFGTSYSIGISPYIKYTDPYSKTPEQKDNNVLNVFIKYQLWKQR